MLSGMESESLLIGHESYGFAVKRALVKHLLEMVTFLMQCQMLAYLVLSGCRSSTM